MKRRSNPTIGAQVIRGAFYLLLLSGGTPLAFFRPEAAAKISKRTLTFAERVAYQRVIEEVYWRHRIWPKENPDPKPSLDAVISQAQLEKKVKDYLLKSQQLEDHWQRPITAEQLQVQMDRMAQHTRQPEVLRELFAALGNDPFIIAECLARPVLSDRLVTDLLAHDQEPLRTWKAVAEYYIPRPIAAASATYTLPNISEGAGCTDDTWTPTTITGAPDSRQYHTAVWTGSEMIVWGGFDDGAYLNSGGRYDPSTDSWFATSATGAPEWRSIHTAVWTGSEMIVWGGYNDSSSYMNTGGRYNPSTDSWVATASVGAVDRRGFHTAVWTGSEMIVWGGFNGSDLNTGGRYNPNTDKWTATSTSDAPSPRYIQTAVWTGTEMIIWGGFDSASNVLDTGGKYNPNTDSWTATSTGNAPNGRFYHTAVWTGSEMIVWGGANAGQLNTGGRYDPSTDSWTATSRTSAPDQRQEHTAVWTGTEMIVWGGWFEDTPGITQDLDTGGRYIPETDSWTATSTDNAPIGRASHTAVWTGSEMIAWGGLASIDFLRTGGRYCAVAPSPTPTPTATATPTSSSTPPCAGCSVTSPNCGTTVFSPPTDFVVELSPPGPAALEASDFTVNGIPADSFMIVSGGATIHFYFNTSPAVQGQNTIHIAACAFSCASGSVPEFTCTFLYEPSTPTPTPSEPPCEVTYSQPACNSTVSTQVTDFTVYVSYFIFPSVRASDFTVNGTPADSASVGSSIIIFHFNASPVLQGENSMHIPRDAFSCINGRGVDEFMCTFTYQPSTPTPTPTATPAPRSTPVPRSRPTPAPRP